MINKDNKFIIFLLNNEFAFLFSCVMVLGKEEKIFVRCQLYDILIRKKG